MRKPAKAIPLLERALEIRRAANADPTLIAETRFALARALWDGGQRKRAVAEATSARAAFAASPDRAAEVAEVDAWFASHR
jgi:hypothetical protein